MFQTSKELRYLKKLKSVSATSALMTDTSSEGIFEQVLCILYSVSFCQKNSKDKNKNIRALISSGSEINIMHSAYAIKLDLHITKINIATQKMNGSHLNIFGMVIADYSVKDKFGKVQFFQKNFLLANISLELILGIFFLFLDRANI